MKPLITRRHLLGGLAAWGAAAAWPLRAATPAASAAAIPTIAARFGQLPAVPQRVFAAGPPAGVLVAALAPQQLMGWPMQLSDVARSYLGPQLRALP
ncbi:MAG: iron ABC transporter substrate-binding protein, partial [Comamonas sp.]|nr:iron ABC transporter substrate-binding protein [Comamonas sp.]